MAGGARRPRRARGGPGIAPGVRARDDDRHQCPPRAQGRPDRARHHGGLPRSPRDREGAAARRRALRPRVAAARAARPARPPLRSAGAARGGRLGGAAARRIRLRYPRRRSRREGRRGDCGRARPQLSRPRARADGGRCARDAPGRHPDLRIRRPHPRAGRVRADFDGGAERLSHPGDATLSRRARGCAPRLRGRGAGQHHGLERGGR